MAATRLWYRRFHVEAHSLAVHDTAAAGSDSMTLSAAFAIARWTPCAVMNFLAPIAGPTFRNAVATPLSKSVAAIVPAARKTARSRPGSSAPAAVSSGIDSVALSASEPRTPHSTATITRPRLGRPSPASDWRRRDHHASSSVHAMRSANTASVSSAT